MTQVAENKPVIAPFVRSLRQKGRERFDAVGFPTTRQEEGRLTSVAGLARQTFVGAEPDEAAAATVVDKFSFGADAAVELVLVNGVYSPRLSQLGSLPRSVIVGGLAESLGSHSREIETGLGRLASIEQNPF